MAVKTNFTPTDFERMLTSYNIGEYVRFRPFQYGADQTNLLLTTTRREIVLRYYEKRNLEYVTPEIELLNHLAKHVYPCAAPIADTRGAFVGTYKGKPFAFFIFLPGEHSDSPENYVQVAEAIGRLHELTIDFKPNDWSARPAYDPQYCWSWAQTSAKRIASAATTRERLAWLKKELDQLELPDGLPKGICHGDTNPANFLYQNGKLSGVLDFDQASCTWLLYDIAQMIYWWTWPDKGDINVDMSRQLLAQYNRQRPMAEEERVHLFDALKLVTLIGIGWFMDSDADFANAKRKVESLNVTGRRELCEALF